MKRKWILICLTLLLCGCGDQRERVPAQVTAAEATQATVPATTQPAAPVTTQAAIAVVTETLGAAIEAEAAALAEAPPPAVSTVLEPEPSGEREVSCADGVIDFSHTEDGYVMARYTGQTDKRLKVLVKGPKTTYSYNLPLEEWTVFPLSDGNGSYQTTVYKNVTGTKYATVLSAQFDVALRDEFAPFLRPNQYVDYSEAVNTVSKGAELCAGLTHPLEKVAAVYDFVVSTLTYDEERAQTVKSGYLPVLDEVLQEERGICFDYAALMTAMLRSQEVPCKLVVGYAGSTYHAWISVWTEENGWVDGAIFFDGHVWKRMDPTFASSQSRSEEIMEFIEHGSYTVKYLY